MPARPADSTDTTGDFHRIDAAIAAWRLAVVPAGHAHAVDQNGPGIAS
ncbi:MAG: hypothetical protein WAV82_01235 [Methylobacter sp.]